LKSIVIIEDDLNIRENMIQIVSEHYFNAIGFEDGNLAIKEILNNPPDLIICDIMMQKISGFKIIKTLKKNSLTKNIPFIFVTARAENTDLRKGMEMGASDYLIKPFTIKQLLNTINLRIEEVEQQKRNLESKLLQKLEAVKTITNHEYNTPLNGIVGLTNLLLANLEELQKKEIAEYLEAINVSANRLIKSNNKLLRIIETLAINKPLKNDKIIINDLQRITQNIAQKIISESLNKVEISFETLNKENNYFVYFSSLHLLEIIKEILDNAIKFATSNTLIKVTFKIDTNNFFYIQVDNTCYIDVDFSTNYDFLNPESCTKGVSSLKCGLYIVNKMCSLNQAELKIIKKKQIVTTYVKMPYHQ
jgi:two-component system sensor histidine kinase/response regulator